MAISRVEFYNTLRKMLELSDGSLLNDTFPPSAPHNAGARILRHGLAVSAFSMLEIYAADRISDLVSDIGSCAISFASFDLKLRRFLTEEAVVGLANRARLMDVATRQPYVEREILRVASYDATPPTYTAWGFSPRGSNVQKDDISGAFSACGVSETWKKLAAIASLVGSTRVSLSNDYITLAATRHQSAHNPVSNIPTNDLKSHLQTAIVIAIAIDILSFEAGQIYRRSNTVVDLESAMANINFDVRFIDQQSDGAWLERRTSQGRPIKRYPNEAAAALGAKGRSTPSLVVCRDVGNYPIALV